MHSSTLDSKMENIFNPIARQSTVEAAGYHRVLPLNAIKPGEPITLIEQSDPNHALDLGRSKLYVKLKVTKANGTDLGNNDRTGLINYPIGTLWSGAQGSLNNKKVCSDSHYHLKAYIEALLGTSQGGKDEHLQAGGFFIDDPAEFDSTSIVGAMNQGFHQRHLLIDESEECELVGPLHLSMFQTGRLIPPGVSLSVTLRPNLSRIAIMANAGAPKFVILDVALLLYKVKLSAESELRMMKGLDSQNAVYRLPETTIRTHHIANAATTIGADNFIVSDQLPETLVIGFVRTEALQGAYKKNVLDFKKWGLKNLVVEVNGEKLYGGGGDDIEALDYLSLFDGKNLDPGVGIKRNDYTSGFYLTRFQIAPYGDEYVSKRKSGAIHIRGQFSPAVTEALTMIVYLQYQKEMQINKRLEILV